MPDAVCLAGSYSVATGRNTHRCDWQQVSWDDDAAWRLGVPQLQVDEEVTASL